MSASATLCLSMIVRNEMANLERCLASIANHIECWVIGDCGSTDGTPEFIRAFFGKRGLPGDLFSVPAGDLDRAHSAALERACASRLRFDYFLLADADMELVVEDPDFHKWLESPCYDLAQPSGVSYGNARLLRRDAATRHHGAYPVATGDGPLMHGVKCVDHATGANRTLKRARDIRLLLRKVEQEPNNGHHWFCLGRTLQDSGHSAEAATTYAKRAAMEGWDEEAWYARVLEARCLLALNDETGFQRAALAAFDQRPQRAEPLYDLARYYRERGMNSASLLYAEAGLALDRPGPNARFVEDFVYTTGLREEYSIVAFYSSDPQRKERGHVAADWLTLSRAATPAARALARSNVDFYCEPARTLMPSFRARPVGFTPPEGWWATNPSIAHRGDQIVIVQRCVNYTLTETGEYRTANGAPIATRNFLLRMNGDLRVASAMEVLPPLDLPPPTFDLVLGFEEVRPFVWRGELWCCATLRERTPEGWCEQVMARIDCPPSGPARLTDWCVMRPEGPRRHETNWMPLISGDELRFIAACDPVRVVNEQARTVAETTPSIAADLFRGGSQAIAFDRGWLALIHEAGGQGGTRSLWHRFVWLDAGFALRGVSRRFCLQQPGVEVASGLAWHSDGECLLITFGINECEAWLATVKAEEVRAILSDTEGLLATGPGDATSWKVLPPVAPASPELRRERAVPLWETAA
jgi:glycosyltransferase involved in cell wall biosynthesis